MSPAWQCSKCLALNWAPGACRTCRHPRNAPPPLRVARPRAILALPRQDFPYGRTHRARPAVGSWLLPVLLLTGAVAVAAGWDPANVESALASTRGHDRATAWAARHDELSDAVRGLRALHAEMARATLPGAARLAPDWRPRLEGLARRFALHGASAVPDLADAEVAVRAVVLELYSLHRRYTTGSLGDDAHDRLVSAARELDRISEDLAHAR
ncbi:MAG: hypothetical protein ACOZNI_03020 [Myxococcota bacterium]